jgi:hypothetical protein
MLAGYRDAHDVADALFAEEPLIETKIRRTLLCDSREARRALIEVVRFMSLVADKTGEPLTPSHRVDLAWHELILFTRTYEQLCHASFGKFVHHQPGGTLQVNRSQFLKTLQVYENVFGPPPKEFWGASDELTATCGTCESEGD